MLRFAIVALVTLEIVLLSALALPPARATQAASSNVEQYIWSFAAVGSDRVVCKKVVMHPGKQLQDRSSHRELVRMSSKSKVVSDSYCANSAKPSQQAS